MNFHKDKASFFIPSGTELTPALAQTSHLAIVAHQDDTEILAYAGIAECFGQADKHFSSVIVSSGAGSPRTGIYGEYSDEDMLDVRREEQNKAALIGDFSAQVQLSFASAEIKDPQNRAVIEDLKQILLASRPQIIYLHNPADKHPTHVAVLLRAITALREVAAEYKPKAVYGCEVWRDLDWLSDDDKIILPTDKYPNIANALIAIFDSQVSGGKRYDLATAGRRVANATYFASHSVDQCESMNFGMDLTPLITDHSLTIQDLVLGHLDKFKDDVLNNLNSLS